MSRIQKFLGNNYNRLNKARVCIVGCGTIGSKSALLLAKFNPQAITLIDNDNVEEENIDTQSYTQNQVSLPKVDALKQEILRHNPNVRVNTINKGVTEENAIELISGHDIAIDGTDNFETRFAISSACEQLGIPFIFGSAVQDKGMVALFDNEICFECAFEHGPETEENACSLGVLNEAASITASLQVNMAIRTLLDNPVPRELVSFELGKLVFDKIKLKPCNKCKKFIK